MKRGELYFVSLHPTAGREQQGTRPVIVVSANGFNRVSSLVLVVPVTKGGAFAKNAGFAVWLPAGEMRTTGVVLCNRARSLDLSARGARYVESVSEEVMGEVLARLRALLE